MNKRYSWIFFLLSIAFVVFSLVPAGYEIERRAKLLPERYFELVHNFPTDYNFYLSRIREGMEGRVTVIEKYTSEPHAGSFIQVVYLMMGWIGRIVDVPKDRASDVYHVARIAFGVTLLILIGFFAQRSFSSLLWQLIAFLLAVTASTWPKFETVDGFFRFGGYMPWWSVMDSLQRITFIPHLLVGQILILALLLAFSDEDVIAKRGNWIFLGILGFILGIVFPPGLIFVYATLFVLIFLEWLGGNRKTERILSSSVFFLLSVPALIYLQLMVSFYPWKRLAEVDIIRPLPFDYVEYIKAVGPMLILGFVGLSISIWRKEKSMMLAVSWVLAWALLLIVFRFVPSQSPLRFSEMIPHVPLGMLGAYFFFRISRLRGLRFLGILPILLIGLGLGIMYSSWQWQRDFVDHKMRATYPLVPTGAYVMYPLKDFVAAMKYLEENSSRSDIVLSETTAGNYMPVISGNTVYAGHDNTVNYEAKKDLVKQFFSGQMNRDTAYTFIKENNLTYIFFGPQETEDGGIEKLEKVYSFLTPVYENSYVTVYKAQ